jgi:hypothetical protein
VIFAGPEFFAADAPSRPEPPAKLSPVAPAQEPVQQQARAVKPPARMAVLPDAVRGKTDAPVIAIPEPPIEKAVLNTSAPAPMLGNLPSIPPPPPVAPPAPKSAAPVKGGAFIWTGELSKNRILTIDKNHPSTGALNGALPSGPVRVHVYPATLTDEGLSVSVNDQRAGHSEPAGARNGWNKTSYVRDPRLAGAVSVLEWPGSSNGWSRLVLRGEAAKLSVILIEWESRAE